MASAYKSKSNDYLTAIEPAGAKNNIAYPEKGRFCCSVSHLCIFAQHIIKAPLKNIQTIEPDPLPV
jgi:hypothetical protein